MKTVSNATLAERIRAAWQAAVDRRVAGSGVLDDFIGGIEVEATDGKEILADETVLRWLEGSLVPSYRYMRAIAKVANYDRSESKRLLYGDRAAEYGLNREDWLRYVRSAGLGPLGE
jgi:hypothetical protein